MSAVVAGRLAGRVALVVGASQGIGRACALRLAREGAAVGVADLDGARSEAVAHDIAAETGSPAVGVAVDVADQASVQAAVAVVAGALGPIDVAHSNAAATGPDVLGRDGDALSCPAELWDRTMAVNARGPLFVAQAVLPSMLARGRGSLIHTTSASGLTGDLVRTAYAASKAALVSLTLSLATQYGKAGIRCNAVSPGLVLSERHHDDDADGLALALAHHLTPRVGEPEDVAAAVAYLASDDAAFVTGHVLRVDGGLLSQMPMVPDQRPPAPGR